MRKVTMIFLVLLFSVLTFTSCKKEEDPIFSQGSKKHRIAGVWKYDKVITTINGQVYDDTKYYANAELIINEDGTGVDYLWGIVREEMTWEFSIDKKYFIMTFPKNYQIGLKIIKLKNNELWLKYENSGSSIEYYCVQ